MPELPEVETVLRTLEKQLQYPTIKKITVIYNKIIDNVSVDTFISELQQETIIAYHRLGKYLIFECKQHYLIVHLRMEGKFYIQKRDDPYDKHTHILIDLEDGKQLRYHDTRKFGRMYLYDKSQSFEMLRCFKNVGLDVFDDNLNALSLYKISRNKRITMKQFLLDQSIMAGVGNIYADEICFSCKLHPCSRVDHLSKKDYENILYESRRILTGAMKAGGTTIRSYTSSLKVDGLFQLQLKVHTRKDETCFVCGSEIEKIKVAGRGTYLCRGCQKRK